MSRSQFLCIEILGRSPYRRPKTRGSLTGVTWEVLTLANGLQPSRRWED
jgi:hypothetical protein